MGRTAWSFTTEGMVTVGQDELVLVLEVLPNEETVPRDIFCHLNAVYTEASKGKLLLSVSIVYCSTSFFF